MFTPAYAFLAEQAEVLEPRQSDINWVFVAGMVQPLIVTLLTKRNVSPGLLRVVNVVLSAAVGALNAVYEDQQNGGPFDWKRAMVVAVGVWLTSATAYVLLWKGTTALKTLDDSTSGFGLGTKDQVVPVTVTVPVDATTAPTAVLGSPLTAEAHTPGDVISDRFRWTYTAEPIAPPPPPPGDHFHQPS